MAAKPVYLLPPENRMEGFIKVKNRCSVLKRDRHSASLRCFSIQVKVLYDSLAALPQKHNPDDEVIPLSLSSPSMVRVIEPCSRSFRYPSYRAGNSFDAPCSINIELRHHSTLPFLYIRLRHHSTPPSPSSFLSFQSNSQSSFPLRIHTSYTFSVTFSSPSTTPTHCTHNYTHPSPSLYASDIHSSRSTTSNPQH